jgi:hypothetical protein
MYQHLFDMACAEAELASYHTCSGFHIFLEAFLFNRKVGASKAIASMYKVAYFKVAITLKLYVQAFI